MTEPAGHKQSRTRPRRRWYQLGMRELLLIVTLAGVALGVFNLFVGPYLRQAEILERIKAIGGSYQLQPAPAMPQWFGGVRIVHVDLSQTDGYSRHGSELRYSSAGVALRDHDYLQLLRDLGDLTDLQTLNVAFQDVTDDDVAHWQRLTKLEALNLHGTLVQDAATWPDTWQLGFLDVGETPMEPAGLKPIARYRGLKTLRAAQTRCDDATLSAWSQLRQLTTLSIYETRVTFASRPVLIDFPELTCLEFLAKRRRQRLDITWGLDRRDSSYLPPRQQTNARQELPEIAEALGTARMDLLFRGYRDHPLGMLYYGPPSSFSAARYWPQDSSIDDQPDSLPWGLRFAELDAAAFGPRRQRLYLDSRYVEDATLAHLDKYPGLNRLNLEDASITDEGLKHLAQCRELHRLSLRNTRIGDAGLKHLAQLPILEELDLTGTEVTPEGLEELTHLVRLRRLDLPPAALHGPQIELLVQCPSLEELNVSSPGIWDRASRTAPGLGRNDVNSLLRVLAWLELKRGRSDEDEDEISFAAISVEDTAQAIAGGALGKFRHLYLLPDGRREVPEVSFSPLSTW